MKSLTFADIEGFDNNFIDIIKNNSKSFNNNKSDEKMSSLLSLKYLIEAISDIDVNKYLDINSALTILISDILKQNPYLFFFGFISPNFKNFSPSIFTLEITNKFKHICPDYFFDLLWDIKKDYSLMDYKYTKENFHILQALVKIIFFNFLVRRNFTLHRQNLLHN